MAGTTRHTCSKKQFESRLTFAASLVHAKSAVDWTRLARIAIAGVDPLAFEDLAGMRQLNAKTAEPEQAILADNTV